MKRFAKRVSAWIKQHRPQFFTAVGVFLVLALVLVPLAYSWAHQVGGAPTGLFGLPLFNGGEGQTGSGESVDAEDIQSSSNQGIPLPEPWDGAERVTILIMGLDYRDWAEGDGQGPSRTDTMILLTIDPVTKTAGMLSIPRDLWAVIPGFNPQKINTAYYFGELYHVPGGGPALAMRTVEQTLGVPIDYYAQVDFGTFIRFIDLLGGVKVDVPAPIRIDRLGSDTIPITLDAGVQVLPGEYALAYARERHTEGGDFARAERQQQIIFGIRDRILDFNLLPGLIANAPQLYNELSSGIDTNLPLDDAIRLAVLASQIKREDITRAVISEDMIIYGSSPDDLAILIPIPDKIRELRDQIFTSNSGIAPMAEGSPTELMANEAALISLQDGTGNNQLLTSTQNYLASQGAQVAEIGSAPNALAQTVLIDHSGNPYTLAYLADLMDVDSSRIQHDFDPNNPIDIEVRLGNDWLNSNPLP